MRKFLITMMCIIMVVCFMPTVAMAEVTLEGSGTATSPYMVDTAEELGAAIAAGGYIELADDITISSPIQITKSVTIDGGKKSGAGSSNGTGCYSINVDEPADRVFNVSGENELTFPLNIDLQNVQVNGPTTGTYTRGLSVYGVDGEVNITLDNTKLTANYYALNVGSDNTNVKVNVDDSTLEGWCALQTWSNNSKFTIRNSVLRGINDKSYDSEGWNNFQTIVVNVGVSGAQVDIYDSEIKAETTTGNFQGLVSVRDKNNVVNLKNCTLSANGDFIYGSATEEQYCAYYVIDGSTVKIDDKVLYEAKESYVYNNNEYNYYYNDLRYALYDAEDDNIITVLPGAIVDETVIINKNITVNISDGTFNGGIIVGSEVKPAILNITGGVFKGELTKVNDNSGVFITGGTFSSDVSQYIPENYVEYAMRNGTYIVKAKDADMPAFTTGNYWSDLVGKVYTEMYSAPYIPPTTPTDNVTNSGTSGTDNATTSADLSGSTSTSNGTTSATVDKTTADKIVDKAVENKSEEIVIDATANSTTVASSTTTAQVTIPTETLGAIAEKTEADVTIKTDVAEVKLDNASAAAVADQAEGDTVQIIAEKVKEDAAEVHFELKVVCSDGKVISDFKGGNVAVTVALPKEMAEKKVVCVYIDDNGHMSKMEGKKNADGTYTFNTGHFSSYAIMAEEEADAAIAAQKEAIKNIKIKLTSKQVKTKAGKKAVKVTWTADAGDKVLDGVEVFRSTERYKGYGAEPFYTSTKRGNTGSYTNTKSLKKGTKYYYRVRGYVLVDGQKVYTDYSTKAWRTVK